MQQHIPLNEIQRPKNTPKFALFNLGFRPFFLLSAIFSIVSISAWIHLYMANKPINIPNISGAQWHAHEMLYGYTFAVIAGFLLTAVKNWTGVQTLHGKSLMALVGAWALARILMLVAPSLVALIALVDLAFNIGLAIAVLMPIAKVKQWRQSGILAKVFLLTLGNMAFYAQALGLWANGAQASMYLGLFLIVSLILVISRRVLPMFIERGVEEKVQLKQHKWADISIMVLLVGLLINALSLQHTLVNLTLACAVFLVNGYRLIGWHTKGIWQVPLLWSFYCGLWLINLGFLLFGLQTVLSSAHLIFAIHLWAIGGIGLITLSMMARVSLGHTGRNIHQPPKLMRYAFVLLIVSALVRAVMPMLVSQSYKLWISIAAISWVAAFGLFIANYARMLMSPRIDGGQG